MAANRRPAPRCRKRRETGSRGQGCVVTLHREPISAANSRRPKGCGGADRGSGAAGGASPSGSIAGPEAAARIEAGCFSGEVTPARSLAASRQGESNRGGDSGDLMASHHAVRRSSQLPGNFGSHAKAGDRHQSRRRLPAAPSMQRSLPPVGRIVLVRHGEVLGESGRARQSQPRRGERTNGNGIATAIPRQIARHSKTVSRSGERRRRRGETPSPTLSRANSTDRADTSEERKSTGRVEFSANPIR